MDEIHINFIKFLCNPFSFPKENLNQFNQDKKIKEICIKILEGNIDKLSPSDFEEISKNSEFLGNCTFSLVNYGLGNEDKSFIELGLELLRFNRKNIKGFTEDYGATLANEGTLLLQLAKFENESADYLYSSIKLFENAREEGLKKGTDNYGTSLANEGVAFFELAKNGIDSQENYDKCFELFERFRKEGEDGTKTYCFHLKEEAEMRIELANKGNDPLNNYNKAIECIMDTSDIVKKLNGPYHEFLINESYLRIKLAESGDNPVDNLLKAIERCQEVREIEDIEKFPTYILSFKNEIQARSELVDLNINLEENSSEISILFERYRDVIKPHTVEYGKFLLEEASIKINLATKGIDVATNFNKAIDLLEKAREEGLEKGTENYGISLAYEGFAIFKLSENEEDNLDDLDTAAQFFEKAREEGLIKGTDKYGDSLWEESNIKALIGLKGVNTIDNLNKVVKLLEKAREEGLEKGSINYLASLRKEAQLRNKLAENEIDTLDNLRTAIELLEQAREEGLIKGTEPYAESLLEESISRQLLSKENDSNSLDELNRAIDLLEKAREEGLINGTEPYAGSLLEEGNIRGQLAVDGVDSINNFNNAVNLFKEAREGFIEGSFSYALSLMNEGYHMLNLSEYGIDPLNNLEKSIELFTEAENNGFDVGQDYYGNNLEKKGLALLNLAQLGMDPIKNLEEAIVSFKNAREMGLNDGTLGYIRSLLHEQIAAFELTNYKNVGSRIDILNNTIQVYNEIRTLDYVKGTKEYLGSLIEEGNSRVLLATLGINHTGELEKALDLYEAAREEGLLEGTPEYVACLVGEGNTIIKIAENEVLGPDTFFKLTRALDIFENAKRSVNEKTYTYQSILVNEAGVMLKLAHINVNPLENIENALKIFNFLKKNSLENIPFKNEFQASNDINEAKARLTLAGKGIDFEENLNCAKSLLLSAKEVFYKKNDFVNLISINTSLGALLYLEKDFMKAYEYLNEAITLIEEMRSSVKIPELRNEYFEDVIDAYNLMVFTCIALNKSKEAFKYSESARGRNFLELLSNEKRSIKGNPKDFEEYKKVLNEIEDLEYQILIKSKKEEYLSNEALEEIGLLLKEIRDLKIEHDSLLRKIKESDPEYYTLKSANPIDPEQIEIIKNKTVIEYFIGGKLAIFVLNEDIKVIEVEINENEIINKFVEFKNIINRLEKNDPEFNILIDNSEKILSFFYDLLIEPVKEYLKKDLIIIPHKYLYHLPFQALKKDKYLIEDFKVSFAYSVSSLKFLNSTFGNGSLIVGNPNEDLDSSEKEAIEIAKLLNASPIIRRDATKDRILKEINNKENIHLACHGYFDVINPKFSRINLSDGFLTTIDLTGLNINAKLIVLSACETALGPISKGDEVEGLVRSMHYAGCRFILASLWCVDDNSTKELFLEFYNSKGDFIDRLREAELKLMKKYGFYYWAPFQIYGA